MPVEVRRKWKRSAGIGNVNERVYALSVHRSPYCTNSISTTKLDSPSGTALVLADILTHNLLAQNIFAGKNYVFFGFVGMRLQ
jgi:hypothetical protein